MKRAFIFRFAEIPTLNVLSFYVLAERSEIDFRYFTISNSYRYIDVLPNFIMAYNDTVHTTTGMATSRVTDADVLEIWRRLEEWRQRVLFATVKFRVGQHVRISKEKMRFAKSLQHNFSTELLRVVKVIRKTAASRL